MGAIMDNATNAILSNKQEEDLEYARTVIEYMYRTQSNNVSVNKNTIEYLKNEGKIEYNKNTATKSDDLDARIMDTLGNKPMSELQTGRLG